MIRSAFLKVYQAQDQWLKPWKNMKTQVAYEWKVEDFVLHVERENMRNQLIF